MQKCEEVSDKACESQLTGTFIYPGSFLLLPALPTQYPSCSRVLFYPTVRSPFSGPSLSTAQAKTACYSGQGGAHEYRLLAGPDSEPCCTCNLITDSGTPLAFPALDLKQQKQEETGREFSSLY